MLRITRRSARRPSSNQLLTNLANRGGAALATTGALAVTAARAATRRQQPPSRVRRVATNKFTWLLAGATAAALASKNRNGQIRARGLMDLANAAGSSLSGRLLHFGAPREPEQALYAATHDSLDGRTPSPANMPGAPSRSSGATSN